MDGVPYRKPLYQALEEATTGVLSSSLLLVLLDLSFGPRWRFVWTRQNLLSPTRLRLALEARASSSPPQIDERCGHDRDFNLKAPQTAPRLTYIV